jgi:hypothetical protein
MAALFTAAQMWAITDVLVQLRAAGTVRIALALALAGAMVAIYDTWRSGPG